jgi:hypothetical protein
VVLIIVLGGLVKKVQKDLTNLLMQDVVEGVVIEKVKERGIESTVEKNVVEIGSIKVLEDL